MALLPIPVIFRSFYALSALPSLAARQTLILMSGESCLVYSFIIVASITSVELKELDTYPRNGSFRNRVSFLSADCHYSLTLNGSEAAI